MLATKVSIKEAKVLTILSTTTRGKLLTPKASTVKERMKLNNTLASIIEMEIAHQASEHHGEQKAHHLDEHYKKQIAHLPSKYYREQKCLPPSKHHGLVWMQGGVVVHP